VPVVAKVAKLSDAKTLDLTDEQWSLMEDMLPALQPLRFLTALFSQAHEPSASIVYLSLWKLVFEDMAAKPDDLTILASFKATIVSSLKERFDMTSVDIPKHTFVIATVLDQSTRDGTISR